MSRKLLTHLARQPLRLPLRSAHRGPLHPAGPGCPVPPCAALRERCSLRLSEHGGLRSVLRLIRVSDVAGDASDAAPSRAGSRLNSPRTPPYEDSRRARGGRARRITACVMRSFTPSHGPRRRGPRLGVHTLPFQAHPRVASRPKSPVRALATLFGLPATLRAETESVLFPCVPAIAAFGSVGGALLSGASGLAGPPAALCAALRAGYSSAPQDAPQPLKGEPPALRPVPLMPSTSSLWPRAPRRRRASSRSAASSGRHSPFPPIAVTASAYAHAAPAPAGYARHPLRHPAREGCHAGCLRLRSPWRTSAAQAARRRECLRTSLLLKPEKGGASKAKCYCSCSIHAGAAGQM